MPEDATTNEAAASRSTPPTGSAVRSEPCDECGVDTEALLAERDKLHGQLEWLWVNCKIVAWPEGGELSDAYPLEHNLHAKKDSRAAIESLMPNKKGQP